MCAVCLALGKGQITVKEAKGALAELVQVDSDKEVTENVLHYKELSDKLVKLQKEVDK